MARILIIDHNIELHDALTAFLEAKRHETMCVGSGEAAVAYLRVRLPDLIILDHLCMPQMQGLTLLESLKHNPRTKALPIIVLSTIRDPVEIKKCLQAGASDYLVKGSFDYAELGEKLAPYLPQPMQQTLRLSAA